ncbi:glycylpeptide N-tetradecanoyltransferase [Orobanche minor]
MEEKDAPAVTGLLKTYLGKFTIAASFDETEVKHWFIPRPDIVESYVVESNQNITDFISFTIIPSSIKGGSNLKSADSFYIASSSTETPRGQLLKDALIIAKKKDIDVFGAVAVMDNTDALLSDLKFKEEEQVKCYYYLYNYRLNEEVKPSEIGLVMV